MKNSHWLSAIMLLGTLGLPALPSQSQKSTPVWPAQVFSPYVDVTLTPTFDLVATSKKAGVQFYNLAFIVSTNFKKPIPAWGGMISISKGFLQKEIAALRAQGSDVMIAFGGAAGMELAWAAESLPAATALPELVKAYQSVIDAYNVRHLDFDIEGAAVARPKSIALRFQAIRQLQAKARKAGKPLHVWFTLPVMPTGLNYWGKAFMQKAIAAKVEFDGVNIMAMDYGGPGDMGKLAIQAATSTHKQLSDMFKAAKITKTAAEVWAMIGVTPMIGRNDVVIEIFDQGDMRELLAFCRKKKIGMLSMWSITRDFQHPKGKISWVSPRYSSIVQKPLEFSGIAAPYTSPWRDLGRALKGSRGLPILSGQGSLEPKTAFSLDLSQAATQSVAVLVLGNSRLDAALLGGVLVPKPMVVFAGLTDSMGMVQWKTTWPTGMPFASGIYYQAWCLDKGAAQGLSASNALESRNR